MADSTLVVKVNAETGQAEKSVEDLHTAIAGLTASVSDLADSMHSNFDEVDDAISDVGDAVAEATDDFSAFGDAGADIFDSLIPGWKGALDGVGGFTKGLGTMKGALISTGLGALVVILGSVVNFFKSSEEGTRLFEIATEALGQTWGVVQSQVLEPVFELLKKLFTEPTELLDTFVNAIKDRVMTRFNELIDSVGLVGSAIKKLFKADFEGAMADAGAAAEKVFLNPIKRQVEAVTKVVDAVKDGVTAFVDDVTEATKAGLDVAIRLTDMREKLRKTTNQARIDEAKLRGEIDKNRTILMDYNRPYEERLAALDSVNAAELQLMQTRRDELDQSRAILEMEVASAATIEERRELQEELADVISRQIEADNEFARANLENAREKVELDREELERRADLADRIKQIELDALDDSLESERKRLLDDLALREEQDMIYMERLQASEEEIQAMRDSYAEARLTEMARIDRDILQRERDKANTIAQLERDLLGESLEAQKQAALSQLMEDEIAALVELDELRGTEEEKEQVRELYRQLRIKAEKDANRQIADANMEATRQIVDNTIESGQMLLDIMDMNNNRHEAEDVGAAKAQFERNKKLQVAQALMNTASAVTAQLAVPQDALTGANFIKAALAAASGAAQIKTIKSQQFDSSRFDLDEPPRDGGDARAPAAIDLSFLERQNEQTGIRAYVVTQDIQNQGMLNQKIKDQTTL